MARQTQFERVYNKLTDEEKEFLAGLSDEERAEILKFFFNPLEELPRAEREKYTPEEVRRILRKNIETPQELTEEELNFIMMHPELARKASEPHMKPFHDIVAKLSDTEIAILLKAAIKNPALFAYKPKPPVTPTPPPEEAKPPEEVPPPEKVPPGKKEKWRSLFPFKTTTFIKKFLMMRAEKGEGAYPYEVYRAFKNALYGIIRDEETRKMFREAGEIKIDGEAIDHELTAKIPIETETIEKKGFVHIRHPIYYVPSYQSFWKYFFMLNVLGLIRKRGMKVPVPGLPKSFARQYYEIVPERIDDPIWEHPQEILYPLSWLGAGKIEKMMDKLSVEMFELPPEQLTEEQREELKRLLWEEYVVEYFKEQYHEKLKEIAKEKGITVEELENIMEERRYIPEAKKRELIKRRVKDLKREIEDLKRREEREKRRE